MNNEPVAWIAKTYYPNGLFEDDLVWSKVDENSIPLYTHQYERPHNTVLVPCDKLAEMQAEIQALKTHPVKELTDEEIDAVWFSYKGDIKDFARAILRKAQEK